MLRGYIKTFNFKVQITKSGKIDQLFIERLFKKYMKTFDYIRYNPSSKTIQITRNPESPFSGASKKPSHGSPPLMTSLSGEIRKFILNFLHLAMTYTTKGKEVNSLPFVILGFFVLVRLGIQVFRNQRSDRRRSKIGSTLSQYFSVAPIFHPFGPPLCIRAIFSGVTLPNRRSVAYRFIYSTTTFSA